MYGRVEIHDVTQHSVMPATFSVQSTHWLLLGCYGNSVSCESTGMLLPHTTRTKQPCGVEVGSGVAELPVANFVINPRLKWYFHNRTDRGGGFFAPPQNSGTTGEIYKIQMAFDRSGEVVEGNIILFPLGH